MNSVSKKPETKQPVYKIFTGEDIDKGIMDLAGKLIKAVPKDDKKGQGKALFLIGAGCSASTGIPLAREIASEVCLEAANRLKNNKEVSFEDGEHEKAFKWLQKTGRLPKNITLDLAYGELFKKQVNKTLQREVILRAAEKSKRQINWAHICLGEMVGLRAVHTVLTTNFDLLVLEGIARAGILPIIADGLESILRISSKPEFPQVVHLHGSLHTYRLRGSPSGVKGQELSKAISGFLKDSNCMVIVGYSGREEGIMKLLIKAAQSIPKSQETPIYWIQRNESPDELPASAKKLLNARGKNGVLIAGIDADNFLFKLMQKTGFGTPEWFKKPIGLLKKRADNLMPPVARRPSEQGSKIMDNTDYQNAATTWHKLGIAWATQGEYDMAIGFFEKALEMVRKVGLSNRVASLENYIDHAKNKKGSRRSK